MAQPPNPNPTLHAKIGSSTAEVNLRDWLNTRLAPFLKRAITESLESEAQYPLQWLGEHLIQQSILFERNPDSTNIKERFLYVHENAAKPAQSREEVQAPDATTGPSPEPVARSSPRPAQQQSSPMTGTENDAIRDEVQTSPVVTSTDTIEPPATNTASGQNPGVNGTMQTEQPEPSEPPVHTERTEQTLPAEDAEMTNAP